MKNCQLLKKIVLLLQAIYAAKRFRRTFPETAILKLAEKHTYEKDTYEKHT